MAKRPPSGGRARSSTPSPRDRETNFALTTKEELDALTASAAENPDVARLASQPETAAALLAGAGLQRAASAATAKPTKLTRQGRQQMIEDHYLGAYSKKVKDLDAVFVAAAMVMDPSQAPIGGFPAPNAVTRTWQHAAWGYTRSVPELNAAMMFVGNCLSRCKLVVGKRDASGEVEQGYDGDEPAEVSEDAGEQAAWNAIAAEAAQYINQLRMPRGGQSEMLRSFGEKIFVAGECYVVPENTGPAEDPTGVVFELLSTQELMPEGDRYVRYYGPGWGTDPLPPGTKPIRVWRCDGQYQMMSTSSVRSCLEILEELVVLTRLVRAAAISRMSLAGMLVIPDELDTPDEGADADGQSAEAKNPLAVDIINTGAKAIDDPASAAAWMPYLLQGPAEFIKDVRHIPFQATTQQHVIERSEAVERLARGLDLPPEKVLGHMQTTYANAGQISEDNFNLYIEPALQMICDALTEKYLWPAMAAARNITPEALDAAGYPEDILSVAITYDARKLISRPDRTKEILELYLKDVTQCSVSIKEVREAVGLDPDGGPEDDEIAKRIDAIRLTKIREVIPAPPSDAAVPIEDATAGKAIVPGQSAGARLAGRSGDAAAQAADQQAEQDAILASAALDPLRFLAERIAGAAEISCDRALEKVGSRVFSTQNKHLSDDERAAIVNVEADRVSRVLGPSVMGRVLGDDDPTLAELAVFTKKVAAWARQAECEDPTQVASESTAILAQHVRRSLYEEVDPPEADLFGRLVLGVAVRETVGV